MSSYFAQLLVASGVQIAETEPEAPAKPLSAPATPLVSAPPADLVEIGAEVQSDTPVSRPISETPPRHPPPAPVTTPAPVDASRPASDRETTPRAVAPGTETGPATILEKHDTILVPDRPNAAPTRVEREMSSVSIPSPAPAPAGPVHREQDPAPTREEILSAVIQWVAAGQRPAGDQPDVPGAPPSDSPVVAVSAAPGAPLEVAVVRAAEPAPPSRRIEEETGVVESSLTPGSPPSRTITAARATPPVAHTPPATSPSVTIGSVHLRIEAPPPPAVAAPPSARSSSTAASGAASRASSLLKLRRHYVLPH